MIKRRYFYLIGTIITVVILLILTRRKTDIETVISADKPLPSSEYVYNDRPVLGLKKGNEKEEFSRLKFNDKTSANWQKGVEKALKAQGGKSIKQIKLTKLKSYIWSHEGTAINVETILVTLTGQQNETTKFKAMVDSESGKILRTWDHPVVDPINPRDNKGIKIDPRYHSEE